MRITTLATDYDGTIAHDGIVDASTVAALERAHAAGLHLLLVTGRELHDLFLTFPQWKIFDRIVAENGALIFNPSNNESRLIAAPPPPEFIARLKQAGIPLVVGQSIVATVEPHDRVVLQTINDLSLKWHIILNKGAVMALPLGVNKASGLEAVLKEMNLHAQEVSAVGDAENDLTFLRASGFPVAVANALPQVQAAAQWVTPSSRGAGVSELIDRLLKQ